jgi:hypothetical protein
MATCKELPAIPIPIPGAQNLTYECDCYPGWARLVPALPFAPCFIPTCKQVMDHKFTGCIFFLKTGSINCLDLRSIDCFDCFIEGKSDVSCYTPTPKLPPFGSNVTLHRKLSEPAQPKPDKFYLAIAMA